MARAGPVALCILDGWGLVPPGPGNAPVQANTPVFDRLLRDWPNTKLTAHGPAVGLPEGVMGNSEVGHLHIGAGRVVPMDRVRIDEAIKDGSLADNASLKDFAQSAITADAAIHVVGIISDSGVHGLSAHVVSLCSILADAGARIHIHALTDGRDSLPGLAAGHLESLTNRLPEAAGVATITGRYYAMDRDRRWARIEKAWRAIMLAEGRRVSSSADAVARASLADESDEFFQPAVMHDYQGVRPGDQFLFTNFRSDRMRQITAAIADRDFSAFATIDRPPLGPILSMVKYFDPPRSWMQHLFDRLAIPNGLGAWLAQHNRTQFRLAETEKFPHVTYFFNGGVEACFRGEEHSMAPSPKVATYDQAPAMAAPEIAARFTEATARDFDFILVNLANPDMVGHTGSLPAAIAACEATDAALGRIEDAVKSRGGRLIVTADHGNCEMMIDPTTGAPHTAHTTSPVPFLIAHDSGIRVLNPGTLTDIAPTVLDLLDLAPPPEMTGRSLID
ncbi:MAG: 2,3-bisphosphoglycerate-independent phosphoglycerate mutase [Rhodobacteraceae bacterium]|nr:2,3-bisphosphoglycerate-independent phosphoglycerate mutase [Paracoccaceae bacterium]